MTVSRAYTRAKTAGCRIGFSCSITDGDDWASQRDGIFALLAKCGHVIRTAQAAGANIVFDLAVYPEDYEDRWVTGVFLDAELIKLVCDWNVEFAVSIYYRKEEEGHTTFR